MSYEKSKETFSDDEISDASVEIEESDSYETSDDASNKKPRIKIQLKKPIEDALKQKEKFKAKKQIRKEKIINKITKKKKNMNKEEVELSQPAPVAPVAPVIPQPEIPKPKRERKPRIKPIEDDQIYPTEQPFIQQPPPQYYQEPIINPYVAPYRKINYGTNIYGISSNTYAPYFLQLQKNTDRNSRNTRTLYKMPRINDYSVFN